MLLTEWRKYKHEGKKLIQDVVENIIEILRSINNDETETKKLLNLMETEQAKFEDHMNGHHKICKAKFQVSIECKKWLKNNNFTSSILKQQMASLV